MGRSKLVGRSLFVGRSFGFGSFAFCLCASLSGAPADPVQFQTHVIEPKIPGGYAVLTVDINKDGRLDVIGVSQRVPELAWYENPTWERHVMVDGMAAIVNLAAADLDGDGIPEIAVENQFAMVPARSEGLVWLVRHQGDPRQRWKEERIDQFSTSHHIVWADLDGDGRKELINGPLVGPKGAAPTYDQDKVPLFWYGQGDWQRHTITDSINGILHRVRAVRWDADRREELLTASFEGITLYRSTGSGANLKWTSVVLSPGHNQDKAPRLGTSDVAVGLQKGKRFLAAVEPWHGNEIVVYTEEKPFDSAQGKPGTWTRRVLFSELVEGHEVAVADFDGDGRDDIVAGDRSAKGATVHVLYAPSTPAGEWHHQRLDAGDMAASGCVASDLNGDGRPDIVCIGSATGNIKWYENLGPRKRR